MSSGDGAANSSGSSYYTTMCDSPSYSEVDSTSLQLPNVSDVHANDDEGLPLQDIGNDFRPVPSAHSTPSTLRCQSTFVLLPQSGLKDESNPVHEIVKQLEELRTNSRDQLGAIRNQLNLLSSQINSAEMDLNRRFDSIFAIVSQLSLPNYQEQQLPEAFDMPTGATFNATFSSPSNIRQVPSGTGDFTLNSLVHPIPAVRSSKVLTGPTNGSNGVQLNRPTAASDATFSIEPPAILPMDTTENGANSNSILNPIVTRKLYRLPAMVKGHLTRRLYNSHEVLELKKTIADTVIELLDFDNITEDSITHEDLVLHEQIVAQLDRCLQHFHDIFFTVPINERMAIISRQRQRELDLQRSQSVVSSRMSSRTSVRKKTRSAETRSEVKAKQTAKRPSSNRDRSKTFIVRNEPSTPSKIFTSRDR